MPAETVMFDVDGVLADFVKGFTATANRLFGTKIISTTEQTTWNFHSSGLLSKTQESFTWETLKNDGDWWERLDSLIGEETWRRIRELMRWSEVLFVTNRASDFSPPGLQTQRWLTNHGIETPSVVVSSKKGEIARAVRATHSLEDKIENAWAIHWISDSPQTKSFLLDRPYNRVQESPEIGARGVIRVGSVEEFLDEVEGEG